MILEKAKMMRIAIDAFHLFRGAGARGMIDFLSTVTRSISFSQYAEDVHSSRIMNTGGIGFYVDIGAAYPVLNSNTYRFYLKGWSGITVEPNPHLVEQHRLIRPRDTIVPIGVSGEERTLTYYRFCPADFNTFDLEAAEQAIAKGAKQLPDMNIPTRPLRRILEEHVDARQIDLMSIDCEGLDLQVLESSDWEKFRPKMLMIEDHQQTFQAATCSPICKFLERNGYSQISRLSYTSFFLSKS